MKAIIISKDEKLNQIKFKANLNNLKSIVILKKNFKLYNKK